MSGPKEGQAKLNSSGYGIPGFGYGFTPVVRSPQSALQRMSLLLLSILYMASLGLVCPTEVRAVGSAAGSAISVGGDAGTVYVPDIAGDVIMTATTILGNDTAVLTTQNIDVVVVMPVYGDTLGRASPDSSVKPPDTSWFDVVLTNAANLTDTLVLSQAGVKYRLGGLPAPDSVAVTFWNMALTSQIGQMTLPSDSFGQFRVAVFVKPTATRNDTLDVTIRARARSGAGGDTDGYIGLNSVAYAGRGDDTLMLSVGVINQKPVADAGLGETTVAYRDTLTFAGAGSYDLDPSDTLTYAWTWISGPSVPSIFPSSTISNPSIVPDTLGIYVFRLVVNDGWDTAFDTIHVTAINTVPVANAGLDTAIAAGQPVNLYGGASMDTNGDPLTYQWTQIAGPLRPLSPDSTVANPSFVSDTAYIGSYVFQLVVRDPFDTSLPDTVVVTAGNVAPVANAGIGASVVHPDTVTLNGLGSSDLNGDTLAYIWTQIAGTPVTLQSSSSATPVFFAAITDTYVFQLIVFDGTDSSGASSVIIVATNTPPLAKAGQDTTAKAGDTFQLSASSSSDSNGDALTYLWAQTAGPGVSFTPSAAVASPVILPTISGIYKFTVRVADGVDSVYDTVTITVGAGSPTRVAFLVDTHLLADTFGNVSIVVVVRDVNGNLAPGETVVFTATHPGTTPITALVTDGSGQVQFVYAVSPASSFTRIRAYVPLTGAQQNFYAYSDKLLFSGITDTHSNAGVGWRMWAPHRLASPPTVADVFHDDLGSNVKVYEWQENSADVSSLNNKKYYTPSNVVRGRAYWVKDAEGGVLDVDGPPPTTSDTITVSLVRGWNQIGSGQFYFVDWSSGVRFSRPGDTTGPYTNLTPSQAKDSSLIKNAVYWYNGSNGYYFGPDSTPIGSALFPVVQMKPMAGFWFYAETAVVMTVLPKPVEPIDSVEILNQAPKYLSAVYGGRGAPAKQDAWAIQLTAKSAGLSDNQNYVGVLPTATAASQSSLYEPPSVASGYVTMGFREPDDGNGAGPLQAAAYAAPITTARAWKVEIYSDLNQPVTIAWDNVSSVPENYSVYLVGPNGVVDLRKSSSLVIPPAQATVMTLAIGLPEYVAGYLAAPLSKDVTFVYPNPGPDGSGLMFFKHNVTTGDVKLKIFDMGGRIVKELGGASPITWDTTNRFGQKVGSGVYIYILESGGNKLVDKLAVVR